jgi:hypothetical protein
MRFGGVSTEGHRPDLAGSSARHQTAGALPSKRFPGTPIPDWQRRSREAEREPESVVGVGVVRITVRVRVRVQVTVCVGLRVGVVSLRPLTGLGSWSGPGS